MGGEHSVTLLAAEEGGTQNFLVPNGTFFFVLAIFLIVLGVIGKFVVPPVQKVLGEREKMVAKTTEDNRKATELDAAADSDFQKVMAEARTERRGGSATRPVPRVARSSRSTEAAPARRLPQPCSRRPISSSSRATGSPVT